MEPPHAFQGVPPNPKTPCFMLAAPTLDFGRIAQDLQIRKVQVESVVQLLDEGNTVPFITRYRKERTGGLDEELIRLIQTRIAAQRQLADRKQSILKSIENQGKLTEELRAAILQAETPKRLEDLYLPYKPKKRSLATMARERGLEPFALAIWNRDPAVANLAEVLPSMVNPEKELPTADDVQTGAQHILAELIAEQADVRVALRGVIWDMGKLATSKHESLSDGHGLDYKDYFQFSEAVRQMPPHRILAINRGEKENALRAKLEFDASAVQQALAEKLPLADHPHAEFLKKVAEDALTRLLVPSLEREVRRELTDRAEQHAVEVFARNLRSLLLQPPLYGRRVLAIDPGFRTGCKIAALDEQGNLLDHAVIFPHQPQHKREDAKDKLEELIRKHHLNIIAIGNGTACRETEEVVSELIARMATGEPSARAMVVSGTSPPAAPEAPAAPAANEAPPEAASVAEPAPAAPLALTSIVISALQPVLPEAVAAALPPLPRLEPYDIAYVIVSEAGASVYSASAIGREEFPDFDATLRGTISIGRRLQDPLSELVKIDPQNIGVGLYQHDISPKHLKESLEVVIESSVNHVGVDLNTAGVPLLRYVAGLNQLVARELVDFRKQHGPFRTREQLLQVSGVGPARYTQAAGFLKIVGGDNPLDRTWVHPESYPVAERIIAELGFTPNALTDRQQTEELRQRLGALSPDDVSTRLQVGLPTVRDILDALARPGRDPREDLPKPIFKKGILKLEDLQPGMELKGTVLNVVDFGAFVDIGLKDSGLVHISQMANRYVKSPYDVVLVGDVVTVWVLTVDKERRRVSLTMIKPGTERRPPEKKPAPARAPREEGRGPREGGGRRRRGGGGRPMGHGPIATPSSRAQTAAGAAAPAGAAATAVPPGQEGTPPAAPAAGPAAKPPLRPAPPPHRPKRSVPKPKLTQAALQGKTPLRTFGELAAFVEAKETPVPAAAVTVTEPPPAPVPAESVAAEPPHAASVPRGAD